MGDRGRLPEFEHGRTSLACLFLLYTEGLNFANLHISIVQREKGTERRLEKNRGVPGFIREASALDLVAEGLVLHPVSSCRHDAGLPARLACRISYR